MRVRGPLSGPVGVARVQPHPPVAPALRRAFRAHARTANAEAFIELIAAGWMLLAVIAVFTISSSILTKFGIHYLTTGGIFYEKLHPATYFTLLAFSFLLLRSRGPIGEIDRMFSAAKLLLVYLACWLFLLIQVLVLERPFTVIIDTFLLPILIALVMWQLSPVQRRPLVWALHLTILVNVVLGYYEYFSGHRLIPLTLGDVVVVGEWRSAALLGHPLTASGVVGAYVLALVLRPAICPPILVRLPLIAFCLASLMAFGGRTSLVTVLAVIGLVGAFEALRLMRGQRVPLPAAILAICVLFAAVAAIFAALSLGVFDKMLLRFSSDKGSALARFATFSLLSQFDWYELMLGPNPVRVNALQAQLGLNYGIENFWISSIVQFGLIHTVALTVGLVCFFVEMLRRSSRAAWAIVLLIVVIAASSVSFSSKNIQLAQFVILISLLLPREQRRVAVPRQPLAQASYRSVSA